MSFRYNLGDIVHFGRGAIYYTVLWRGWLVLEVPSRRQRVDVYWPGEDTWDCYGGDELWSIGQYPF